MPTNSSNARIAWIGLRRDPLSAAVREVCRTEGNLFLTIYSEKAVDFQPTRGNDSAKSLDERTVRWTGDAHHLSAILSSHAIDILFVAGCHYLLASETLEIPDFGCYNVHPSMLPLYRGSNPIFWQYQRGDLTAGVTVHSMDTGMDTGPICAQEAFTVALGEPLTNVVPRYSLLAAHLTSKVLSEIRDRKLVQTPQRHLPCPFIARKPTPSDYLIDWGKWPLHRIWHFLRMSSFVANAALPDVTSADHALGTPLTPRRVALSFSEPKSKFTWEVGEIESTASSQAPGSIWRDTKGWAVHHPEGCIRLERRER